MVKFKTSARTIELLGRKQIRDSVTALAELMKNSYDADADWHREFFNIKSGSIILADNGCGMARADLEQKWFVLGTSSKSASSKKESPKGRPYLGAKGIGRLAAARLGKHFIMCTKTDEGNYNIVYLIWDIFEDSFLALEDIEIPCLFDLPELEITNDFESIIGMLADVQITNIEKLEKKNKLTISTSDLKKQVNDQREKALEIRDHLRLIKKKGTIIYISNLQDDWNNILVQNPVELQEDISAYKNYTRLSNFVTTLNSTYQNFEKAYQKLDNFDKDFIEIYKNENLIKFHDDFSKSDFEQYDIKFEGRIEDGCFYGKLFARNTNEDALAQANKYLEKGINVTHGIKDAKKYDCGIINVVVCHLERKTNTSLTEFDYERICAKIELLGGLGVYRDQVRVLPYGEPSNDFLEIETRRSKNAGDYVFSHRNIFGRIDISAAVNPNLEDKSSREGLIENEYYYYFMATLKNLLTDIARDFLSDAKAESFMIREFLVKNNKRRREEEQAAVAREKAELAIIKNLLAELKKKAESNYDIFYDKTKDCSNYLEKTFVNIRAMDDGDFIDNYLLKKSDIISAYHLWKEVYRENQIKVPERYRSNIDEKLELKINKTNANIDKLYNDNNNIFDGLIKNLEQYDHKFQTISNKNRVKENKVKNALKNLQQLSAVLNDFEEKLAKRNSQLNDIAIDTIKEIQILGNYRQDFSPFKNKIEKIKGLVDATDFDFEKIDSDIAELRKELFGLIEETWDDFSEKNTNRLAVIQRIQKVVSEYDNVTNDDIIIGQLRMTVKDQAEQIDIYQDLANFGMAAEIQSHEFNQLFTMANEALSKLENKLEDSYSKYWLMQMNIAFSAIYDRQKQLSPMYKDKDDTVKEVNITSMVKGVLALFSATAERNNIVFKYPQSEDWHFVKAVPSRVYPVVANILSNAIYWVQSKPESERIIKIFFDQDENSLYIEDNGEGIHDYKKSNIFKPFYSSKPNGRGLGLSIAKSVLEKDGHSIEIADDWKLKTLKGACFRIKFRQD